jgi:glycosyltransferase involved in cell wall biosynthesis
VHVAFSLLTLSPGGVGGSETYSRGLLGAFAEGHGPDRVTVLVGPVLDGDGAFEVREVAPQIATGGPARLAGLLRGMVLRDPSGAGVLHHPLTVPAPRPRGPSVLTLHDVLHRELPSTFGRMERAFRRLAYDRAANVATRVVTVSEYSRGQIVKRLGIAPERVVAIHSGVDHERFTPTGAAERPTGTPFVLYPATLLPHKNHERLISALGRIEGVALVLTGAPSPRLAALENHARREGVEMHHVGYVDDLAPLYRGAMALVFPSLAEGEQLRGQGLERAARLTWATAAARHAEVYAEALRAAAR